MGQYLIDTNTAIDFLDDKLPEKSAILIDENEQLLSVITRMELLAWKNATASQLQILQDFINNATVFGLEESIIVKTIAIRKNYGIKLPDAIIAATALTHGLILMTRNTKDFATILDLQVLNPHEL